MFRRVATASSGLLVLFHAWLLGSQLWDGQLAEPGLVLRWLVAAGLVAALAGLRRSGASIFWGRKAVSIWLLATLLHGPAVAADIASDSPALPEAVTALVQIAAASAALGLGLLLIATLLGRRSWPSAPHASHVADHRPGPLGSGRVLPSAARPPPFHVAPAHV